MITIKSSFESTERTFQSSERPFHSFECLFKSLERKKSSVFKLFFFEM